MAIQIAFSPAVYLVIGTSAMILMIMVIIAFALAFQRKLAKKAREYREIEKLVQQQELQSAYFVIEGQEHERKRIAAELHDNIGGHLATLKIYSDLTLTKDNPEDLNRFIKKVNEISISLGDEIRKISHELDLRTLSGFGLKVAVEHLCEAVTNSGKLIAIPVIDIQGYIDDLESFHLYRIIQELVTNTLKHSGATQLRIEITQIEEYITLIYEDNGRGFDLETINKGMGIQNIKTRVKQVNGNLTIDASIKGTTFIIEIICHA